jgi:hypothetical protein
VVCWEAEIAAKSVMVVLGVQSYESQITEAVPAADVVARVRTLEPHTSQGERAPVVLFLMPKPKEAPIVPTGGAYKRLASPPPVEMLVFA